MLVGDKLRLKADGTNTEAQIARFVLQKGVDISGYTTRSLATEAHTSPATVVRFCKGLGLEGFSDFKRVLLEELDYFDIESSGVDVDLPFESTDSLMKVANKIGQLHQDAVEDTLLLLSHDTLRSARNLVRDATDIHVFSAGTSMNQAESFREKMLKIGRFVSIPNNLNYQTYEADCLGAHSLALIISYSGETASMVRIAWSCKRDGVPILALTSYGENSIAQLADCRLCIATKESMFEGIGDYSTHASVNLLLDILYSHCFQLEYEKNLAAKRDRARRFESGRSSTSSVLMPSARAGRGGAGGATGGTPVA